MIIALSIIISIILQFIAGIWALTLLKKTKFNISWILMSMALVLMGIRSSIDLIAFMEKGNDQILNKLSHWLAILISIVIAVGIFYIRKIFKFLEQVKNLRESSEKRVLTAIIETEEKERKRFAKELHDGLGPLLSSIKMSVSGLFKTNDENIKQNIIKNIDIVANEAIISIKEISNSLSPHILNNFGLHSAIKSFIDKINGINHTYIEFHSNIENQRFEFNTETILYRVICELINNTIKHASAKEIFILIHKENNNLTVQYKDNGIGFNVDKMLNNEHSGMGYFNIFSRMKSINGNIRIESEQNLGVNIIMDITI